MPFPMTAGFARRMRLPCLASKDRFKVMMMMREEIGQLIGVLSDARQQASAAYPFATFFCLLMAVVLTVVLPSVLYYRLRSKQIDAAEQKSFRRLIEGRGSTNRISAEDASRLRHQMTRRRP